MNLQSLEPHSSATGPYFRISTNLAMTAFVSLGVALFGGHFAYGQSAARAKHSVQSAYGNLPLSFEANQGQADDGVRFTSRGDGYALYLTGSEAQLSMGRRTSTKTPVFERSPSAKHPSVVQQQFETESIRMQLVNAKSLVAITGQEQLPGNANYLLGNDPSKWHVNVPTYSKVKYTSVYNGIDLVYYGNQRQLEYDFLVAPHADPHQIRLHFGGAAKLQLAANGDLEITGHLGQIAFHKPALYQPVENQHLPIQGRFTLLAGNTVGFSVGSYNRSQPLVIDPVLVYSTFLSGSGVDTSTGDFAYAVAADAEGNAYVSGEAFSTNFPTTASAYQKTSAGFSSNFVSKLNPAGTALLYSTYIGGASDNQDSVFGMAVDANGNAYITGDTFSTDYPVTASAFRKTGNGKVTGFVTKLNPTGTALVYSTYLGGTGHSATAEADQPYALAIDNSGNAYITGYTLSTDFPVTPGAFQTKNNTPYTAADYYGSDGFVTKLNPEGSALVYSTYLGGTAGTQAYAIAVDSSGNAYVTGVTYSTDHPITSGAFQTKNLDPTYGVSFVTKLNPTGTALVYSTYLGGNGLASAGFGDSANGITVDSSGDAYVAGATVSPNFPVTKGAFQTTQKGQQTASVNGFVTKLNPAGSGLIFSTYLGGTGQKTQYVGTGDSAGPIAIDSSGNVFVGGDTFSSNFPITSDAYQSKNNDITYGVGFVSELDPTGSKLLYSTYFGGTAPSPLKNGESPGDTVTALALDPNGNVYIAGATLSTGFPITKGAFQTTNNEASSGGDAAFVAKLTFATTTAVATTTGLTSSMNPAPVGQSIVFTAHITADSGTTNPTGSVTFSVDGVAGKPITLNTSAEATYTNSTLAQGAHTIKASYSGAASFTASSASLTETITAKTATTPIFSPAVGTYAAAQSVTLTDATSGAIIYYTTNGTTPTTSSTRYTAAIKVSSTETIEAIAVDSGYTNSPVVKGTYTITTAALTVSVSPTALTFASLSEGSTSPAQIITLKNTSKAAITLGTATFTGTNTKSFIVSSKTCTTTLAAGASCAISIEFHPAVTGSLSASLSIPDNATGSPQLVALKGTATPTPTLSVSVTPTTLTFASLPEGSTSPAQTITLKNTGSAALKLGTPTFTGTNPKSFLISSTTCATSLAPGASCTLSIKCKPAVTGALSASLSIPDNATASPQLVTLKATATVAK